MYAAEPRPDQRARSLCATAAGVDEHVILLWIYDRPRPEMSAAHFRRCGAHWSEPYLQSGHRRRPADASPRIADALIRAPQITALDLYTVAGMRAIIEPAPAAQRAKLAIADDVVIVLS